jgi:hypothetical protein
MRARCCSDICGKHKRRLIKVTRSRDRAKNEKISATTVAIDVRARWETIPVSLNRLIPTRAKNSFND